MSANGQAAERPPLVDLPPPKEGIPGVVPPDGVEGPASYPDGDPIYDEKGRPVNPRRGFTDEGGFYIHLADPGFPEYPWPGERRLGPYPTLAETREQVAHDIANGQVSEQTFVGVFDEAGSVKRLNGQVEVKAKVAFADVSKRADEVRAEKLREQARAIDDQRAALEQLLPEGVSVEDMMKLIRGGS